MLCVSLGRFDGRWRWDQSVVTVMGASFPQQPMVQTRLDAPRAACSAISRVLQLEGSRLGDKMSLERQLHEITGIPVRALQSASLAEFGVDERMAWARDHQTKRGEDQAYSLLGLFDVSMLLIYGEGTDKAFCRLQKEIYGGK